MSPRILGKGTRKRDTEKREKGGTRIKRETQNGTLTFVIFLYLLLEEGIGNLLSRSINQLLIIFRRIATTLLLSNHKPAWESVGDTLRHSATMLFGDDICPVDGRHTSPPL